MAHSVSHSHPIRVLLGSTAIPANLGGAGHYVDDLVPKLVEQGVDLAMAVQERGAEHFATHLPSAHIISASQRLESRPARMAWEQTDLSELIHKARPDVLHSPHYTSPQFPDVPVVITLHDVTLFSHPQAHSRLKQRFFAAAIHHATHRTDALVVSSLATRDRTIKYVGGDPSQFYVACHGMDRSVFHPVSDAERERIKASLDLKDRDYIGFPGTLEPRKNVPNLVRGWVKAVSDRPNPPALMLAGDKGWDEDADPALASVPECLTVPRPGYLPLEDLPGFLSGCVILIYPSIMEGFELPVLEAVSCGATTLTIRLTSLSEADGDTVAYCGIDPDSTTQVLTKLLNDPARREALGAAAIPRADESTWVRVASIHIGTFRTAARS